jgi:secreted PhoX family phosphatase
MTTGDPSRRSLVTLTSPGTPGQHHPSRTLPLLAAHPGGRSATVCHYRCGDACSQPVPNTSDNEYFGDVLRASLSRRTALAGTAAAVVLGSVAREVVQAPGAAAAGRGGESDGPFGFTAIEPVPSTVDDVTVPEGFTWTPVVKWGDPILPGAPEFDFDDQTPAAQAGQFGYNNDFLALVRLWGSDHALLVSNHEFTNENLMFRGWTTSSAATLDQLRIAMLAHGMSVVAVSRRSSRHPWTYRRRSQFNRRLTVETPFVLTGPAAGSDLVRTSADPAGRVVFGTLNNCAGGVTPWGTVLSGEENFNQYFAVPTPPEDPKVAAGYRRYGIADPAGKDWFRADPRFGTVAEPNEPHRFGWVVEVDPYDPKAPPRKHTALGRFKHEGANIAVARDGRVAAYMGDDERFDYLYKFVSKKKFHRGGSWWARRHNMTLLEEGDLYVARFTGVPSPDYDGDGTWIPLTRNGRSVVEGMSTEEVLVWTRLAADTVGATKMDRPEDVEPSPRSGKVYAACTNNTSRTPAQVDAANPRAVNKDGHVIEITEKGGDAAARTFSWKILIVCGDPADPSTYFSGFDKSEVSPISCPDNVAFDRAGNLWIATDGQADSLGLDDALLAVPVRGSERGHTQQFLAVPTGAETCGPVVGYDDRTVLVAVQHPGDVPGASPDAPKSRFPFDGTGQPRPSVIQVHRTDGRAFLPRG